MLGILATVTPIGAVMEFSLPVLANDGASNNLYLVIRYIRGRINRQLGKRIRSQPISAITNKPIINLFLLKNK